MVAETPYLLVVNPGLPYASLAEFLAAARAKPGALNMGSVKLRAGINLTHVPYKSAGAAVADVVGGQIQSTMSSPPAVLPLAKAGKLRVLAAASARRSALMAIASPELRERLASGGLEPAPNTPEEFNRMIVAELQRWTQVIRDAGIKQE